MSKSVFSWEKSIFRRSNCFVLLDLPTYVLSISASLLTKPSALAGQNFGPSEPVVHDMDRNVFFLFNHFCPIGQRSPLYFSKMSSLPVSNRLVSRYAILFTYTMVLSRRVR